MALSNCAGGRRVMKEDVNVCKETTDSAPELEQGAKTSSKYK